MKYKRKKTEKSQRRSQAFETQPQRKSKSSLPSIHPNRKPPTPPIPSDDEMESIAISDHVDESWGKLFNLNMRNHFEEEEKAQDMKTIDPSNSIKPFQNTINQEIVDIGDENNDHEEMLKEFEVNSIELGNNHY